MTAHESYLKEKNARKNFMELGRCFILQGRMEILLRKAQVIVVTFPSYNFVKR